jgi:hypothetical protein
MTSAASDTSNSDAPAINTIQDAFCIGFAITEQQ